MKRSHVVVRVCRKRKVRVARALLAKGMKLAEIAWRLNEPRALLARLVAQPMHVSGVWSAAHKALFAGASAPESKTKNQNSFAVQAEKPAQVDVWGDSHV